MASKKAVKLKPTTAALRKVIAATDWSSPAYKAVALALLDVAEVAHLIDKETVNFWGPVDGPPETADVSAELMRMNHRALQRFAAAWLEAQDRRVPAKPETRGKG